MIAFQHLHPRAHDLLGFIPDFLNEDDPRSAREQFDTAYAHGGGWSSMPGWKMNRETGAITYPGDPPLQPIAKTRLRDEIIFVYPHAWVAIVQPNDSFEVSRMD